MGAFRRPKMQESEADKQLRKDIERRRKEEEEEKIRLEKEQKDLKIQRVRLMSSNKGSSQASRDSSNSMQDRDPGANQGRFDSQEKKNS